jgi:excisionase family DNA binding protein
VVVVGGAADYDRHLRVGDLKGPVARRQLSSGGGDQPQGAFDFFDLCHPENMTPATQHSSGTPTATIGHGRDEDVVFPREDLDQLLDLAHFVESHTEPGLLLGPDGEQVPLPAEVYRVLRQVVEVIGQGKATLVAPQGLLLTTQEAADFLGVSRPTLVKLLEDGAIPFEKPNRHRRVRLQDLIDFQQRRRAERRVALNQLTEEADELGLYEGTPADYATALRTARRRRAQPGMKA